jgi:hypothetical protein
MKKHEKPQIFDSWLKKLFWPFTVIYGKCEDKEEFWILGAAFFVIITIIVIITELIFSTF